MHFKPCDKFMKLWILQTSGQQPPTLDHVTQTGRLAQLLSSCRHVGYWYGNIIIGYDLRQFVGLFLASSSVVALTSYNPKKTMPDRVKKQSASWEDYEGAIETKQDVRWYTNFWGPAVRSNEGKLIRVKVSWAAAEMDCKRANLDKLHRKTLPGSCGRFV